MPPQREAPRRPRASASALIIAGAVGASVSVEAAPPAPLPKSADGSLLAANLVWKRRPSIDDYRQAFPSSDRVRSGRALVRCRIADSGTLTACRVVNEAPTGAGYGKAALALADRFVVEVAYGGDDSAVGQDVNIPILFDMAEPAPVVEAQPGPDGPLRVVTQPNWLSTPTPDQMAAYYPPKAWLARKNGRARVQCALDFTGRPHECAVQAEEPAGLGFGQSLSELARRWRARQWTASGESVEGALVTLDVGFSYDGGPVK